MVGAIGGYRYFSAPKPVALHPASVVTSIEPGITSPVPADTAKLHPRTQLQHTSALSAPPVPKKQQLYPVFPDNGHVEKKVPIKSDGSAQLAIIIDDMGSSLVEARSLAAIKVPITFAIIPGLKVDSEVASFAASQHIETMIHMPMQSKGWPARRLEANGLLVGMATDELQERMNGYIKRIPNAIGANNHMGSEFTEQEEKMTAVMQILKKNGLFFIDSVTSSASVGGKVAGRLGVKTARRNVFLDNEQERGYIMGQLEQAVRQARKNGTAIAICHPHHETIAALAAALPGLEKQGITLVPASRLVK
jgi:polysaccharide deacetylase 2 family uncharacterized protein YibQ